MKGNKYFPICIVALLFLASCSQNAEVPELDIPEDLPEFEILSNAGNVFEGYILLRKLDDPGATFMINSEGKVIWYQRADTTIVRVYKAYNDAYYSLQNNKELYKITYDGDTLLKLQFGEGGFDRTLHHEVFEDSKGRIVGLTNEIIPYDLTRFGGQENDTLITDGILVLSKEGEKLWHWSFDQVLDTLSSTEEPIFQIKNDWAHANSIYEDVDGNYLISWRDLNQVWKINSNSGDIMWKYGGEGRLSETDRNFQRQHGVNVNLDGDYMIFDNLPDSIHFSSRAVAFNFADDELHNTLVINLPDSVFTQKEGSVFQFEKEKFLFCVTRTNDLIITNREGDILWHAKADIGFYRAYYLEPDVLRK